MAARLEFLDARQTPLGVISLRRRHDPVSDQLVYEAKLDDEFLMSSLFTAAEEEVARLALAELVTPVSDGAVGDGAGYDVASFDVVVGGLGLGYTAHTVLADPRVRSLIVVDALAEVVDWHRRHLVPLGKPLTSDPRCRLMHGDFFGLAGSDGFDADSPKRQFDAVIVDIDHSPRELLHPSHAGFYEPKGVQRLADHIRPGGIFSLWSNDPPDAAYEATLAAAFTDVRAEVVRFDSALPGREATNTVYLASAPTSAEVS